MIYSGRLLKLNPEEKAMSRCGVIFGPVLFAFLVCGCAGTKPAAKPAEETPPPAVAGSAQQSCDSSEDYLQGKCCDLDDKVEKTCYYACKRAEGSKTGEQSPMSLCECWRTAVRECSSKERGHSPKDIGHFGVCNPGQDADCPPGWYGE
jgi:hypothetical protein